MTRDELYERLAQEIRPEITEREDGGVAIHWIMTPAAGQFLDTYAEIAGMTRDAVMDDIAAPLPAKWRADNER